MPHPDLTAMVIAIIAKEYKNISERLNNNDFFMIFFCAKSFYCAQKNYYLCHHSKKLK